LKHPDEEKIEQFALNPSALSTGKRDEIQEHIRQCFLCERIYTFFSEFYAGHKENTLEPSSMIYEFIAGIYPVIPLSPFAFRQNADQKMYMTVLAAMTTPHVIDRFTSVAVLASEAHQAVVRVLQDTTTNRYKIFVITDDPDKRSHALLSFPDLSLDFVTDDRGQLEVDYPVDNWKSNKGFLRIAIAEHVLPADTLTNTNNNEPLEINSGLHSITVAYVEKNLQITTSKKKPYAPDINVAVVSGDSDETLFIPLPGGNGMCSLPELPESLTLRLYC